MDATPELSQYPCKTYDKLRYGDTDRQGHVNNAVFSTLLETGRVEILLARGEPLTSENCSFVIASLSLEFRSEVTWPGRVEIGTRVAAIGRSSMTLDQGLFQDDRCVATARTVIVQTNNATRSSQPLGDTAVAYLTTLMSPTSAVG